METVKLRSAGIEDLREIVAVARPIAGVPCWSESVWANVLAADDHAKAVFVAERLKRMVGFVVVGCVAGVASACVARVSSGHGTWEARRSS
jgi:hypothetical protein